jgi:DNA segregation ATPase FtsK/SpoIIIE, S-DNA-T family
MMIPDRPAGRPGLDANLQPRADGLADAAAAHRIRPDEPGTGYVIDIDGSTTRVRADYWPDSLIRSVAKEYGLASQRHLGPAEN